MAQRLRFSRLHGLLSGLLLACLVAMLGVRPAQAQVNGGKPPQSVRFNNTAYSLAFQQHPMPGYSQYAYLSKGDKFPYYRHILMLEWLVNDLTVEEMVESQIEMLDQRKEDGDLTVNYRLIKNEASGEYLLDFVLSNDDPKVGGITEWNAYRYVPYTDDDGEEGGMIYGYSARGYGADGGRNFLLGLNKQRASITQALAGSEVPKLGER